MIEKTEKIRADDTAGSSPCAGDKTTPVVGPHHAEQAVSTLLEYIGEDPHREGLAETPRRVATAYRELLGGYREDPAQYLRCVFEDAGGYRDLVLVRAIPFFSLCEHHMLPFVGTASIGYFPDRGVVGLSKLARVVTAFSRRLQTQEKLTAQIIDAIEMHLRPRGAAIVMEAEHHCMLLRGIQKQGISTVTTRFSGVFETGTEARERFLRLCGH